MTDACCSGRINLIICFLITDLELKQDHGLQIYQRVDVLDAECQSVMERLHL